MGISETCPLCKGWVWHRNTPCNCRRNKPAATRKAEDVRFRKEFGKRLVAFRKATGLKQIEIRRACGLSSAFMSDLEHGGASAGAGTLIALAKALGVTPNDLLGWEEHDTNSR